jgi:cobalt-zinc-cadmium efflux system membrane fusion protein
MRCQILVSALLLSLGCSKMSPGEGTAERDRAHANAAASAHTDEPEHPSLPKRVRLPDKVIEAAKIRTVPVAKELLAPTMVLPGEVVADPDKSALVSSPTAGRLERVTFREGSAVRTGDILAIVRVPDLGKARASYTATTARAAAARAEANRLEALAEKRLAATQEVVTAKAEAEALEAEARAADEQLRAMGTGSTGGAELVLRAPVAGTVIARDAVVGQAVTPAQTIASIADLSEVWFLARVFEKDLGRLGVGAQAEVELNAYAGQGFQGEVEYVGRQIDPAARTLTARIRLTNRDDLLRIGLFGTARIAKSEVETRTPVLVVPRSAITEIADRRVAFVREPDGDFEMHEVVLGDASVGKVAVVSGLREGEPVVVEGVFTLKSAVLKGTFGEEGE